MKYATVAVASILSVAVHMGMPGRAIAQEEAVKIGVMTDLSGPYAGMSGPGTVAAVQMAVEDLEPTMGRKIELEVADHQNKPDIGTEIARRWYDSEGVDIILDVPTTPIALAVQDIAGEKHKLAIFGTGVSDDITGANCNPYSVHWAFNVYSLTAGAARAIVNAGGKTWFFITADYAFGHALQAAVTAAVEKEGGTVVGAAPHPLNNLDFSAAILSAQSSGADVVALANGGLDMQGTIRQAREFGLQSSGQRLAALVIFLNDIDSLGLEATQGLTVTTAFYWDRTDESRAWAKRFFDKTGKMPTMLQAAMYSAATHYLSAVKSAGTKDADAVMKKMKETRVNDMFTKNGYIRDDGMMMHDMFLAKVKAPSESSGRWDYYTIEATIPAEEAFISLADSSCPMVKNK